jgi:hypothetical protein
VINRSIDHFGLAFSVAKEFKKTFSLADTTFPTVALSTPFVHNLGLAYKYLTSKALAGRVDDGTGNRFSYESVFQPRKIGFLYEQAHARPDQLSGRIE